MSSPLSDSMLSCRLTKWSALISGGILKESEIKGSFNKKPTLLNLRIFKMRDEQMIHKAIQL